MLWLLRVAFEDPALQKDSINDGRITRFLWLCMSAHLSSTYPPTEEGRQPLSAGTPSYIHVTCQYATQDKVLQLGFSFTKISLSSPSFRPSLSTTLFLFLSLSLSPSLFSLTLFCRRLSVSVCKRKKKRSEVKKELWDFQMRMLFSFPLWQHVFSSCYLNSCSNKKERSESLKTARPTIFFSRNVGLLSKHALKKKHLLLS